MFLMSLKETVEHSSLYINIVCKEEEVDGNRRLVFIKYLMGVFTNYCLKISLTSFFRRVKYSRKGDCIKLVAMS